MIKKNIFIKTALAVILTVITLSIISCSNRRIITVEENEFEVRFSLTGANTDNFSAVTVSNATYTYAPNDSFTLTATKTNLSSSAYAGNFFHYTVTPANVISISTNTTTNSITFELTNMEPGSVKLVAIATNNLGQTNGEHTYTINLQKASYPVATPPIIYVTTNQVGITGDVLTYGVQTGSDKRSTYQNTTMLSNISGSAEAGISADGTVMVTNGTATGTSVFEVRLTSPNYVDYVVRIISEIVDPTARLKEIIAGGVIPADFGSDPLVKDILGHLGANVGASIKVLYVTESGSGDQSGTGWVNSIAATNLRNKINGISDASASKVYAVLVAGGMYKPVYITTPTTTDRTISFSMKNHVAVIGGFAGTGTGSWDLTGTTTFSGNIGNEGLDTDNTYRVFSHTSIPLNNGVLYGVTISDGRANDGTTFDQGGGMYNNTSSPRLIKVVFTGNSAGRGGGMYNLVSSPVLTSVVFTGNSAGIGGGMFNQFPSSPVLTSVVFTGNSASRRGGGLYNDLSADPVLTSVVFNGNTARDNGGGMYNARGSAPVLIGVVFTGNRADYGGGVYVDNDVNLGPLIVNTIFAGNTAGVEGPDILMGLVATNVETIRIAGSVLGIGTANPINGIVSIGTGGHLNLTYNSLANTPVNFGANATTSATMGGLTYPTISGTSSAKDLGLYVRRSGTDYYFSENTTAWHTNFTATGGFGTAVPLPGGAEDLTATDIAGNPRVGRPDAGVYEVR